MTGEELEALRNRIGAPSQEAMAELLQCDPAGYRRYATGTRSIPRYIERSACVSQQNCKGKPRYGNRNADGT